MALSVFSGRRNKVFDPFSLDIWDPFEGFGALANIPSSARETIAIANTRIDWKETREVYIFKAYPRWIKIKSFEFTPSKNRTLIQHQMALSLFGGQRNNIFDPFSLDIWDPFEVFGALANTPSSASETTAISNTRFWNETLDAHIIKAYLPGFTKEQVKVEFEDDKVLHICEKSRVQEENETSLRVERSSSKSGRVGLPENVKPDQVKATLENGVLTVTLLKEVKTPNVRPIEIS